MSGERWLATVYYRTEGGTGNVTHPLEELSELGGLVEHGPHWSTIERIEIVLCRNSPSRRQRALTSTRYGKLQSEISEKEWEEEFKKMQRVGHKLRQTKPNRNTEKEEIMDDLTLLQLHKGLNMYDVFVPKWQREYTYKSWDADIKDGATVIVATSEGGIDLGVVAQNATDDFELLNNVTYQYIVKVLDMDELMVFPKEDKKQRRTIRLGLAAERAERALAGVKSLRIVPEQIEAQRRNVEEAETTDDK